MQRALIVGGSSGLGSELASALLASGSYEVHATGRKSLYVTKQTLHASRFHYHQLDIGGKNFVELSDVLDELIYHLPHINLFVYAAGFDQRGTMRQLYDSDIDDMIAVGLAAPAKLLQRILEKQEWISGFIAITSTSQWTPRKHEPVYAAVKAGLGMLAQSVALDPAVRKTLIAAPAGMATQFWRKSPHATKGMLDPRWVADNILTIWKKDFRYCFARILREPPRVEIVETQV